jgi:Tfp pilus assembly protein PilV
MNYELKNSGFSLTEVLLAVGTLAIGMVFIAGVFPAGIHFTTIATERTIAATAADEAFAKIKLYAKQIDFNELNDYELNDFNDVLYSGFEIDPNEFSYPSTGADSSKKQYCWSALLRLVDPAQRQVQVTVFVSRKASPNLEYFNADVTDVCDWPVPVKVSVVSGSGNKLTINAETKNFINDGCTIVNDNTGKIYRVLERYGPPNDQIIQLDRSWDISGFVWVVPPPVAPGTAPAQKLCSGRYPCIAVYQMVIRF